jgi:hypothetical protein
MKKFTIIISSFLLPLHLFSQNITNDRFDFGISLGTVFPGKIEAAYYSDFKPDETFSFKNKSSLLIKAKADYNIISHLSIGICLNYVPIKLNDTYDVGLTNITIHMVEFDAAIKGRFWATEKFALKPGIALGFRETFSSESNAREKGFCLNAGIEGQFYFLGKTFLLVDCGFFTQPYGGVYDVVYVRAGPVYYANIGLGIDLK